MKYFFLVSMLVYICGFAQASPESAAKYSPKCESEGGYSMSEQVSCLNAAGFDLVKITAKNLQVSEGKNWFKLYSLAGKDITPSLAIQKKYFAGSMPDYRFVNRTIHAFYPTAEDSTELCLSAESGKKITCPEMK